MSKTTIWTGAAYENASGWTEPGNWSNGVPVSGDNVVLRVGPNVPRLQLIHYGTEGSPLILNSFTIEDPTNNENAENWSHIIGGNDFFGVTGPMNLGSYCSIMGGVYNGAVRVCQVSTGVFNSAFTLAALPTNSPDDARVVAPSFMLGTFRGMFSLEAGVAPVFTRALFDRTATCDFGQKCAFMGCSFVGGGPGSFTFHDSASFITTGDQGATIMTDNPVLKVTPNIELVFVGYVDGDYTIEQLGTGGNPIPIKPRSPISSLVPGAIPEEIR